MEEGKEKEERGGEGKRNGKGKRKDKREGER